MLAESIWLFVAIAAILLVRLLPAWRWPTFTSDAGFHLLMRRMPALPSLVADGRLAVLAAIGHTDLGRQA